jgi:hypothetical protein
MMLFLFACQHGQEKDQIIENLRNKNNLQKKIIERERKENRRLDVEIRNIKKRILTINSFEEKGFIYEKTKTDIQILQPGVYHGKEVSIGSEKMNWFGLIKQSNRYVFKKVKIGIYSMHDALVDRDTDTTGKRVIVTDSVKPIILISGLSNTKEGEIPFVELKKHILYPSESMNFKFNDNWTSITAYGTVNPTEHEGPQIRSYLLEISSSKDGYKTKQFFAGTHGFDDAMFTFIWAGDLDADGAIDLIMDLSNHYNVDNITLFLSSKADEGQLLKRVAELKTTGC